MGTDDLVSYWSSRRADWILVPWIEAHNHCWRCGLPGSLQRCHIVPDSLGGRDEPANLIRLCVRCHREQPNVADPEATWEWLRDTRHSGRLRFHAEWMAAYERAYGEAPGSSVAVPEGISERVREALAKAIVHWGEGMPNAETVARAVREAEDAIPVVQTHRMAG